MRGRVRRAWRCAWRCASAAAERPPHALRSCNADAQLHELSNLVEIDGKWGGISAPALLWHAPRAGTMHITERTNTAPSYG